LVGWTNHNTPDPPHSPSEASEAGSVPFNPVHERTLLGAIDSYMSALVHVRPYLAHGYRQVLADLAERWLDEAGANSVTAVAMDQTWLSRYVAGNVGRGAALKDFLAWAGREGLLER